MKTHHKIVCIWLLSIVTIKATYSQNSFRVSKEKELARMSINTSRLITENENVGDIFQNYINQIQKTSTDLGMEHFKFDSKSFSLYKEEDTECLRLSIELSMMFHYDSKKVNALSKALHATKNKT
ncbi:hypothetical protein [Tenacibaculum sp. SDUM215027]|uniref:hypothetical protein n=1 Tax=Tenacibaculum sp. SDUM215027 TaxID=3422596 RepID=UPI003D322B7C